jgi:hypothetical protein
MNNAIVTKCAQSLAGFAIALAACGAASAQSTPAAGAWTVGVEALAVWQKASPTPTPIITDAPLTRTGVNVLLGGGDVDTNPGPGLRISASYAASPAWSLDASFFGVDRRSTTGSVASSGLPGSTNLLLPYFDVNRNRETTTEISFAGSYSGSASTEFTNRLMGAEANVAWPIAAGGRGVAWFAGFRWLQLEETYAIVTSSPVIPPQPLDIWTTNDTFDTSNNFYGGQIGIRGRYDEDRWYASGSAKLALGAMVQEVGIAGSLVTNDFTGLGAPRTYAGGYFALPSNIGNYSQTEFAVIPELALSVGYRITPSLSIFAGYSALYASSVVRPGNQINRNVNATQSVSYVGEPFLEPVGPAQPSFSFNTSDFWAQSVSVGLEVRF